MENGVNKNWGTKTGVWWDINTCPVPYGYDVGRVRECILSEVWKQFDPRSVTIFAIGNLEVISPHLLKEISSAGILLSHHHVPTKFGASLFDVLCEWKQHTRCVYVMLISGNKSWYSHSLLRFGYMALRAFPDTRPPAHESWPSREKFHWDTFLLKGPGPGPLLETDIQIPGEPALFCRLCKITSQSCEDFIEHLKSIEHASAVSPEHHLLEKHWDGISVNEFNEPLWVCKCCNYRSYDRHNMIIHFNSKAHEQKAPPCEAFQKSRYPLPKATVVLWDLNTCPVPAGYDIGCVRPSIESALKKLFGNLPVTVFAIGNLEFISPRVLKYISSSGILLIHTPFECGSLEVADVLHDWRDCNPSPGNNALLISGNEDWCSPFLLTYGHTMLRAFPKCKPAETYDSYKDWLLEDLLKENYSSLETLEDNYIETAENAWFCKLCEIHSQSFDCFIDHLKSEEHQEEHWENVPRDRSSGKPIFFCTSCNYSAHNRDNLTLHLNTEQHSQNLFKQQKQDTVPQNLVLGPSEPHQTESSGQGKEDEDERRRR